LELCISLTFGFALGSVFFLSLWWVVFKGLTSERPALWFVASFFTRVSLCLLGFYFIADGNWLSLVISLVGFMLARPVTKLLIGLTSQGTQTKGRVKDAT
jgi:F1F0 ATPase subunit 2